MGKVVKAIRKISALTIDLLKKDKKGEVFNE